jgi:endo-1,4-beta-D-glucanase Y
MSLVSNRTYRFETLHDSSRVPRTAVALVLLMILVITACAPVTKTSVGGQQPNAVATAHHQSPTAAAHSFLSRYVDPDGRVVRHDQGGDTVSEGQGYALLISVAIGDRSTFASVWHWTRVHLQQPSGALAFHWSGGRVVDTTPATDADLQTAWALSIAATRFHDPSYATTAKRIAKATVTEDVGYDDAGRPTLSAGPWAITRGKPTTVEPGYWTFPAEQAMASLTGDNRWRNLPASDLAHLKALSRNGSVLTPDWAELGDGQSPHPVNGPQGSPVQDGPDGMRAMVWTACTPGGRHLDAAWWRLVSSSATAAPLTRGANGTATSSDVAALSAVSAAAAAAAAGNDGDRDALLDRATAIDEEYPTYYGAAWVALGRLLLTTNTLANC